MSASEAEVKKLLKNAKRYLTEHEFEDCLDEVKEVLELDSNNYFAYILRGKAFHSLNNTTNAISSYKKAISINKSDLLAWKGLYLVYKNDDDFVNFFDFLQEYIELVNGNQELMNEIVKDINVYNKKFNKNFVDQNLYAIYLKAILPDQPLGRSIGLQIQPFEKTIEELLKLSRVHELKLFKEVKRMYPLNPNPEQQLKLNKALFKIYSTSEIPLLYGLMINTSQDDNQRHYYEDLNLVYNYELIKVLPSEKAKEEKLAKLIDEVQGMIVIRHSSQNAWYLYFDLVCSNLTSLDQLNLDELCWYVCNFPGDMGLRKIIQGYLYCEISPFNQKIVDEKMKEYQVHDLSPNNNSNNFTQENVNTNDDELVMLEDDEEKTTKASSKILTTDEVFTLLTSGIENADDSLFGSRIVISYYIHMKEYLVASERTRSAVRSLANLTRSVPIRLPIYKRFLLLSLATIYTYFEAPKNFSKALDLYDRVEQEDPDDVTVKIGKGFILIEKGEIETAKEMLREAVKSTRNLDAQIELAWCQIQTHEIEEGRQSLERILKQSTEVDLSSMKKRAMILWRIAESYLIEAKTATEKDATIKKAFDCIIQSLKQSKTYAPSYTSLGIIYKNYYNDSAKAIRCFYKSFELDNSDLNAAKELVTHYAELQEWPMCQVLCERLISNAIARRVLTLSKVEDNSWPYRILGICHLELQQDAKSVEYFQNAIRLNSQDTVSWSCLGEAYFACGRLEAALKVFDHCLKLAYTEQGIAAENSHILYMLASVHSSLGNFSEAITLLEVLLEINLKEVSFVKLYCQVLSMQALYYIQNGLIGRGIEVCLKSIHIIYENRDNHEFMHSQTVWKHLSDALVIFLYAQESVDKLNVLEVEEILGQIPSSNNFLASLDSQSFEEFETKSIQKLSCMLIRSSRNAIEVVSSRSPRELRASTFYNLAINYLHAYILCPQKHPILLQNSIEVSKKVLQLHDKEASYWVGLGIASFLSSDAPMAQHCLIKALALAPKDPLIWCDLALLYMKYDDFSLAKETFTKVQAISPASNVGWIGTAMIEEVTGDKEQAWKYFTHGFVLSNGRSTSAQLLYTHSILQKTVGSGNDQRDLDTVQELTVANFAISDYLKKFPNDILAVQMALSIIEKLGDYERAITLAEKLSSTLEALFEFTEDEKILLGFARAKSTLGRLYLGSGNYNLALENAQFSLDVSEENIDEGNEEMMKIVLSSRVVIGLALFFTNNFDGALEQLKLILVHQEANETSMSTKENLFVLVSQILYTKGTEESIQAAIDEIFAYIEGNGSTLLVALTLGSIALVKNLEDILPAVRCDLLNLDLADLINDRHRQIPLFISQINEKLQVKGANYDQRTAFMFPNDMKVWENLNNSISLTIGNVSGQVSCESLSESLVKCGKLRQIQRGLFLNSRNLDGYKALAGCLATTE